MSSWEKFLSGEERAAAMEEKGSRVKSHGTVGKVVKCREEKRKKVNHCASPLNS